MEVGVKESSKNVLVRSAWASHLEKWEMKNWQRADAQKEEGKWKRGRPKLHWGIS